MVSVQLCENGQGQGDARGVETFEADLGRENGRATSKPPRNPSWPRGTPVTKKGGPERFRRPQNSDAN